MAAEWASYGPDARAIIRAFVAGVNARIAEVRERPPIEFTLLGFLPEPWSETVPLQRLGALAVTNNASQEVRNAGYLLALGRTRLEALAPNDPWRRFDPAPGLDLSGITAGSTGLEVLDGGLGLPRIEGSNNWVVSGRRTVTGKPLLANDPHRAVTLPSLRYLTHLVGPGLNVIGAGEPGVPGVAGGHNGRVSFGYTIVGMDQQDVYVERVTVCPGRRRRDGEQAGVAPRCSYSDGRWVPLRVVHDTIMVKGEAPRVLRLEFTRHGPIFGEDSGRGRAFALRFVGSEPGTAGYMAQLALNRVRNWAEFLQAAGRWKLPTENLIYADTAGNIGWVAAGLMPIRSWSGVLPVPGDGRYEWKGFLPFKALPKSFNPASGFIATANNNILPPGYAHPLNYRWAEPFRADRITELLGGSDRFSRADFERLQHDELSIPARRLVPVLLAAAARGAGWNEGERAAIAALTGWDYVMRKEARAPLVFEAWFQALGRQLLSRLLRGTPGPAGFSLGAGKVVRLIADADTALGPSPGATRDSVVREALGDAVTSLTRLLGPDPGGWIWGTVHLAGFRHPLAAAFDLPAVARGGNGTTLNATSGANFRQTSGASFRMVVDLADFDNSTATSVPGQSGQPGSEYYGNLLPLWGEGKYFPLLYSRGAVERETRHVLWLRP